jgi:hypothetical protein
MGMRKFAAWSERAVDFAARLAKYQSPRLRAVAIAPPPSVEEKPRRFTLKVFTGGRALEPPIEPVPEPPRDPRYPKPPRFGWTILARPSPSCADDDDRSCLSPASPPRRSKAEKKESTGHRLSQLCPPCATPSSNFSPVRRSDAPLQQVDQQQASA